MKPYWKFIKNNSGDDKTYLVHNHDEVDIFVATLKRSCGLCKEKIPANIKTQALLLNHVNLKEFKSYPVLIYSAKESDLAFPSLVGRIYNNNRLRIINQDYTDILIALLKQYQYNPTSVEIVLHFRKTTKKGTPYKLRKRV